MTNLSDAESTPGLEPDHAPPPTAAPSRPRRRPRTPLTELPCPAYEDAFVTLYQGNSLELLPLLEKRHGKVDHGIYDPPYSAAVQNHSFAVYTSDRSNGKRSVKRHIRFAPLTSRMQRRVAELTCDLVRGWTVLFSDDRMNHGWRQAFGKQGVNHIVQGLWVKPKGSPKLSGDRPAHWHELLECFHHGGQRIAWQGGGGPARYEDAPVSDPRHPTTKPLRLMSQIVHDFAKPGQLVLDPFAGLGKTLVACKSQGIRAIGIELNPYLVQQIIRDVSQELLPFEGAMQLRVSEKEKRAAERGLQTGLPLTTDGEA